MFSFCELEKKLEPNEFHTNGGVNSVRLYPATAFRKLRQTSHALIKKPLTD